VRAYVGLGANLGDGAGTLAAGVHALSALPGVRLVGVSRLFATAPVGVTDQPEFRNAVVALDVPRGRDPETGALGLLLALKAVERAFGRRERERWGPRELDLDLLLFGRHAISVERPSAARSDDPGRAGGQWLEVPHPGARERLFVLAPLADLAPGLRPPGWGETVATARDRRASIEGPGAARPVGRWDGGAGEWMPPDVAGVRDDGAVAPDGSPVAVYLDLPGEAEAALLHGALVDLGLAPDCDILELGCGAGRVTASLAQRGHEVVAVDQSVAMLAEVRRRVPGATVVQADIETLDLGRRHAAVVLGSHLVNAGTGIGPAFLAACRRHVADGGVVLIQAYDPDRDWTAGVGRRSLTAGVVVTLLRADRAGDRLAGSVAYEARGRRWVQDFSATLLDEDALRAALEGAGLRFVRWIDRASGWLAAGPA
jgi:2-amino-4-hydroxy-6-hydroxymethyldihydropteridine diphosphokinase